MSNETQEQNEEVVGGFDIKNECQTIEQEEREVSYGEKAVGLKFNPGKNEQVNVCKQIFAGAIDQMDMLRRNSEAPEVKRLASVAITEMQTAQMWAVKALTWKD